MRRRGRDHDHDAGKAGVERVGGDDHGGPVTRLLASDRRAEVH
jgi:hypothetical protein